MANIALILFIGITLAAGLHGRLQGRYKKNSTPPHCTQVTKDTDYASHFRFDYPVAYIPPGQSEAYQKMYCVSPPAVYKAMTTVCDWVAPPQVVFTLGDDYVHIIWQDPTNRYLGNAVINTYQLCNHNLPPHHYVNATEVVVDEIDFK